MVFKSTSNILMFFQGLLAGLFMGTGWLMSHMFFIGQTLMGQTLIGQEVSDGLLEMYQWLVINLGFSAVLFVLIVIIYGLIWQRIFQRLKINNAENWKQIIHYEHLLDMLTSLSFGVGVIWTAIGMREALMAAFGDNEIASLETQGALGMLEQLINGGILTALTSTVLGGIIGYVLRIIKTLALDRSISDYQEELSETLEQRKYLQKDIPC